MFSSEGLTHEVADDPLAEHEQHVGIQRLVAAGAASNESSFVRKLKGKTASSETEAKDGLHRLVVNVLYSAPLDVRVLAGCKYHVWKAVQVVVVDERHWQ